MIRSVRWSTASFGEAPDSSPMELSDLQEHVHVCQGLRGRWFVTRCHVDAVHGFMVARFVTTVAVIFALASVLVWVV
jgi:hypothetical protein